MSAALSPLKGWPVGRLRAVAAACIDELDRRQPDADMEPDEDDFCPLDDDAPAFVFAGLDIFPGDPDDAELSP